MLRNKDLLEALPVAVYTTDAEGVITFYNEAAAQLWDYRPELGSKWCGSWRLYWPDGTLLPHDQCPMAIAIKEGRAVRGLEAVAERPDRTRVPFAPFPTPIKDESGHVTGAINVLVDLSERKEAEKLQALLVEELSHRVKNTLATVQAVATQSLIRAKSQSDFVSSFSGRIQAMAKVHGLLTQTRMRGTDVMELVREQVRLGFPDDERINCSGPYLFLDAPAAIHLGMVLHELTTNARKYGALSTPSGRLSVSWEMRTSGGRSLFLQWNESDGPKVRAPSARGFGTALIEQTLRGNGGRASIHFGEAGLACEIRWPLPEDHSRSRAEPVGNSMSGRSVPPAEGTSSIQGKRILVVEEEPLVAMEVESHLSAAGATVVGPAGTEDEAKRLAASEDVDAALLDVNLNGRPVEELVASLARKKVPFAFVTGYGRKVLPKGFQDTPTLSKPFSQGQLLAIVEAVLSTRDAAADVITLRPKRV